MDEREIFEAWACDEGINLCRSAGEANEYAFSAARYAWRSWQAVRRTTPDRDAVIEECAKVCDDIAENMDKEPAAQYGADLCAERIRELKTAPTASPSDVLVEEIADMVDHMGEGRRLEEYVAAIREMRGGNR